MVEMQDYFKYLAMIGLLSSPIPDRVRKKMLYEILRKLEITLTEDELRTIEEMYQDVPFANTTVPIVYPP